MFAQSSFGVTSGLETKRQCPHLKQYIIYSKNNREALFSVANGLLCCFELF